MLLAGVGIDPWKGEFRCWSLKNKIKSICEVLNLVLESEPMNFQVFDWKTQMNLII
jgi:hypothetical protein